MIDGVRQWLMRNGLEARAADEMAAATATKVAAMRAELASLETRVKNKVRLNAAIGIGSQLVAVAGTVVAPPTLLVTGGVAIRVAKVLQDKRNDIDNQLAAYRSAVVALEGIDSKDHRKIEAQLRAIGDEARKLKQKLSL